MKTSTLLLAVCALAFPVLGSLDASDFDVVINEINYNPLSGEDSDEFVELFNRGGTEVDLSDWAFVEGIQLLIPQGVTIGPRAYLLVGPDSSHTSARYGAPAIGDYGGKLDNDGEIVTLVNATGELIGRVHYGDGGIWSRAADGLGPTLELIDAFAQPDLAASWDASRTIDGTPGAANSALRERGETDPTNERLIIAEDEVWRYRKGTSPYPQGWQQPGFNDGGWDSGPTGIGYDDGDDRTELLDMEDGYISFAARKTFSVSQDEYDEAGEFLLLVLYDDAFVAWLNDVEVARQNLGAPGSPVAYNDPADGGHEADDFEVFTISKSFLQVGSNTLAVEIHNADIGSSDASFVPRLVARPPSLPPELHSGVPIVINEVKGSEGASEGFIELFNLSGQAIELDGFSLVSSAGDSFDFAAGTDILGGGHLLLDDDELGFETRLAGRTYVLLDLAGEFVDGFDPRAAPPGDAGLSFGRVPDGDEDGFLMDAPSPGAMNAVTLEDAIVINEVLFHPPFVAPDPGCERDCSDADQWIELYNRSGAPVDIGGWALSSGVELTFAQGTTVPAGGYLVVAASRTRFLATHPGVDPAIVIGDWARSLSHDSETINLRDRRSNLVDHVKYGDGGPLNDLEPEDDVDDETFIGSEWPTQADGSGRTIELANAALDNRHGGAWRAGPVAGTPGAVNATWTASPDPVIGGVEHLPALPRSSDPVTVRCRVSAASAVSAVRLLWQREGGGASGTLEMRDDGLSGDDDAGDGRWAATIPAQPNSAIVSFQIEATAAGRTTAAPRAPVVAPYNGFQGPFYLYETIDASPPANPSPSYTVIMTEADADELADRDVDSDVLLPCTFISVDTKGHIEVRHVVGIRYRGSATRDEIPRSYRLELPAERDFEGLEDVNLNSQDIENELLASDLFRRAGMPAPISFTVNLRFQGALNTRYVRKEQMDTVFLERFFGGSDGGNLYRAINPDDNAQFPEQGDLRWLGEDPDDYRPYYSKRSNREADDYSDVIELCRVFDPDETPDEDFPAALEAIVDVWQWARFFAVQACLSNIDGGIHTTSGEDYLLYRVPADSNRLDAGKWILVPWDIEETFENSSERLFRPSIASIRRFLEHQRYAPYYYCNIVNLRQGVFARRESRQRFRLIDFLFDFGTIDGLDAYITARLGFFDLNIPLRLSSGTNGQTAAGEGATIIARGDTWRYWPGTAEPPGSTLAWTRSGYDDSAWLQGPSGFGFGDGDDATIILDMLDNFTTVYIRKVFNVQDPAALPGLTLSIDYDDGFVAYVNGVEAARNEVAGAPGSFVAFDDTASGNHEAGSPERFDISHVVDDLVAGDNVIALIGLNRALDSGDLSLEPELLVGGEESGSLGCGELIYTTSDTVPLSGRSNACDTREVLLDGVPVAYDTQLAQWSGNTAVALGRNVVTVTSRDMLGNTIDSLEVVVERLAGGFQEVSGTIDSDAVWTPAGGPYHLVDDIVVSNGATLEIEAGSLVFADNDASILVDGELQALGTQASPIIFRAGSCADRWGGIGFRGTGTGANAPTHVLRWCDFEFGDTADGAGGFVGATGSKVLVDTCAFRLLTANAVDVTSSRLEVRDSTFEAIEEGVHGTNSTVVVTGCTFDGMVGDKDGIDFDGDGTERSLIQGCLFLNGSDDGIDLGSTSVDIIDNVFVNVQDKALSLERNGSMGPPTVVGNLIFNCGTAVALKSGVTVNNAHHNTIVGNQEGINLFAKDGAADGGHGVFHSSIVWNNTIDVKLDNLSSIEFTESNISAAVWPGAGNISLDPMLANVDAFDFSLRPGSPCIGTGRDGTDMGAIPFTGPPGVFVRGDADSSGGLDILDATRSLDVLFRGGAPVACVDRLDANDDGRLNVSDPVRVLIYLFASGPPLPAPFPDEGEDPTADALVCP